MIQKTKDYGKFSYLRGNRKIDVNHVKQLVGSISQRNLLKENPIVVNNLYQVLDGQHRLEAAKKLGLEIYYLIVGNGSLADVWLLNTSQKNWSLMDYVDSYITRGYQDYVVLKDFCQKYGLPLQVSSYLLSSPTNRSINGEKTRVIKSGLFAVSSLSLAIKHAAFITELRKFTLKGGTGDSKWFLNSAIALGYLDIDHKKLLKKIETRGLTIPRKANTREYLSWYEEVYNFRNKEPVRFY